MNIIKFIVCTAIAIIALVALINLLSLPFKLLYNGIIGAIILYAINWTGIISLKITVINSLIAGFFGIPGIIGLVVYNHFLK